MEVKRYQGESLAYLTIEPDHYIPGKDYPMVVMLHGYATGMSDLAGLAPIIGREGYVYTCPNAPIAIELSQGRVGYGWSSPGSARLEEEEAQAAVKLDTFFDEVFDQYDVRPGNILLMGFSQGGSLTLRCGLPRPEVFVGLAGLSCYLPDKLALADRLPSQRNQPVFIAHGTNDQYVPLSEGVEVRNFLENNGYRPEYREYPMRHEVSSDVIGDLVPWINELLTPLKTP